MAEAGDKGRAVAMVGDTCVLPLDVTSRLSEEVVLAVDLGHTIAEDHLPLVLNAIDLEGWMKAIKLATAIIGQIRASDSLRMRRTLS